MGSCTSVIKDNQDIYCRSVDPQGKQWVLLASTSKVAGGEEGVQRDKGSRVTMTQLGVEVDGSRFS